jgi:hypothetical protein
VSHAAAPGGFHLGGGRQLRTSFARRNSWKEASPMKTRFVAGLAALAALAAVPAFAQAPAPAAVAPPAAAGALSVEKTPIGTLWANPAAKAVLLKELPPLEQYIDQIKDMTLSQVAPMSQGALDDAKLKAIQVQFDAIK